MKRITQKQMNQMVSDLLRNRNYQDINERTLSRKRAKPSEARGEHGLYEVALKGVLANASSDSDVICLSQAVGDFTNLLEKSYKNFLEYVQRFKSKQRVFEQLLQLELPLFLHIFIELFECGHKISARRFFRDHKNRFNETSDQQIISSMETSLSNFNLESSLKAFKNRKFSIRISDKCLEQLKKHFDECNDLVIIQMINAFIDVHNHSTHSQSESEKKINDSTNLKKGLQYNELDIIPSIQSDIDSQNTDYIELKRAIDNIRNSEPCVPPLNKYTITSSDLCSAAVADDISAIAFGFEDSSIYFKRLGVSDKTKSESEFEVKRKSCEIRLNGIEHNVEDSVDESLFGVNANDVSDHNSCDINQRPVADRCESSIFRGHGGPVYDLKFVPNNNLLLSCSYDTTVRLWDTTNSNNLAIYTNHLGPVFSIDLSLIGNLFITGGKDSAAFLWSLERTFPLRIFSGHSDGLNCVLFHPNCKFVITASADKEIKVWDINTATAVRTLVGHEAPIYAMTISSCGLYLASAGEDRKIKLWDIMNAHMLKEFSGHTDSVFSLSFNHCNEMLSSCGADQTVKLWNCSQITALMDRTHIQDSESSQSAQRNRKDLLKTYRVDSNVIYNRFMRKDLLVSIASKP